MTKLTFKEYYESKERLLNATNNLPKIIKEYVVKKYCKIPLLDNNNNKDYIALKPKDTIKILWEFQTAETPEVKSITIENIKYSPCWNDDKLNNWINTTTLEKGNK